EDRGGRDLVDQAEFPCAPTIQLFSGEHQVERIGKPEEAGKALGPARTGQEAELHLRQSEFRFGRVAGDAVRAGECDLEATPERGSVDRGDYRYGKPLEPVQERLAGAAQRLAIR